MRQKGTQIRLTRRTKPSLQGKKVRCCSGTCSVHTYFTQHWGRLRNLAPSLKDVIPGSHPVKEQCGNNSCSLSLDQIMTRCSIHRSFTLYQGFLLSSVFAASGYVWAHAHPAVGGLGGVGHGPCPFQLVGSGKEYERDSASCRRSTKQRPFRALAEEKRLGGDGGIPEGGYQAVMKDLQALMTDSKEFWPGDFAGTPHGPHYGGYVTLFVLHAAY
jgi:hypothetical protein